jgi:hypothetical protein
MEKEVNILYQEQPRKVILGGKEYTLSPVTLFTLANIEHEFGCGIGQVQSQITSQPATSLAKLLYALLRENYPEVTPDQAAKLVTLEDLKNLSVIITEIMAV